MRCRCMCQSNNRANQPPRPLCAQVLWDRLGASDATAARAAAALISMIAATSNGVLGAPAALTRLDACCLGGGGGSRAPRRDYTLARSACIALQKLPAAASVAAGGDGGAAAAATAARERVLASCVDHICAMVRAPPRPRPHDGMALIIVAPPPPRD